MCDNCVKAGKMSQAEADEQRDMIAEIVGGTPMGMAPEDILLASLLENPADAYLILSKMVQGAFSAGWSLGIVRNDATGESAIGLVHLSGVAIPMGLVSEETARAIANDTPGK